MKKFILAIFGIIFTSFILSSNSYADSVSDYVYVWDWDTHPSYYLCGENSGRACSDYSYVIFEPSGTCTDNGASFWVAGVGSFNGNSLISACSKIIAPVNSSILMLTGGRYLDARYSGTITMTLTDDIASCNCPEPEPTPPCPDPEENSQYINVVLDSFWKYHKAFAGAVVAIIVIFLVYRLIKGVMR